MKVFRKGQPVSLRFLVEDETGPLWGFNMPESSNSIDQQNEITTGAEISLSSERIINLTPTIAGLLIGVELFVTEKGTGEGATVCVELQRYNGTSWVTNGISSILSDDLDEGEWNLFKNFTKTQSFVLSTESNRWRLRIYEDDYDTPTKIATSDDTNISFKEHTSSVHLKIYKSDFDNIYEPDRMFVPSDILALPPLEEDFHFMSESDTPVENIPERMEGVYLLNLPNGLQDTGQYVVKYVDERGNGRMIEQIRIVSGILDAFGTILLEFTEEEIALSVERISGGKLEVFRGDSARWYFTVYDRYGNPVNLTDAEIQLTVKETEEATSSLISVTATITDAVDGIGEIYIPATSTEITPNVYVADIELTLPTGDVRTLFKGSFIIKKDVRR